MQSDCKFVRIVLYVAVNTAKAWLSVLEASYVVYLLPPVVSEVLKHYYNRGQPAPCYYWQDKTGREIDLLLETDTGLLPLEVKSGMTLNPDYFDQLQYWNRLSGNTPANSYVLYGGTLLQRTSMGTCVPLAELNRLLTNGQLP
ncbi:hypothetical protein GCM10023187_14460 [Nibrella viscosa]|uniref:DUF4143 domain-containing protein n=1 Tax=Nibrella viscosa TaxID=1084524 RepID=A0ABP8K5Z6_9BACT